MDHLPSPFFRRALLLFLSMQVLSPICIGESERLKSIRTTYEKQRWQMELDRQASLLKLRSQYLNSVRKMAATVQKQGNLDLYMGFSEYIKDFEAADASTIPDVPEALSSLQAANAKLKQLQTSIDLNNARSFVIMQNKMNAALMKLQQTLTREGLTDDAVTVKAYREKLTVDPTVVAAYAAVSAAKKNGSSPAAKPKEKSFAEKYPHFTKGLVFYLSFDEKMKGSLLQEESRNGFRGDVDDVDWEPGGRRRGAGVFDGNRSSITFDSQSELEMTGDQTIAFWMWTDALNKRRNPIAKAFGGECSITMERNGTLHYFYGTSGDNREPYKGYRMTDQLKTGEWVHLVVTRNLRDRKVIWYRDGEEVISYRAVHQSVRPSRRPLLIGAGYVDNWEGMLDEVMIFDQALNERDVRALYRATLEP